MSIAHNFSSSMENGINGSSETHVPITGTGHSRPLHRIADARRRQGVSLRSVARRLNKSAEQVRRLEEPTSDMLVSELYEWQQALEVPIREKLQTLLRKGLERQFPLKKFDTIALGFSGTGQSAQLPYYERNRKDFKPDIVVLVFVLNDFANNSAVLEGLRQGWHRDHSPFHRILTAARGRAGICSLRNERHYARSRPVMPDC